MRAHSRWLPYLVALAVAVVVYLAGHPAFAQADTAVIISTNPAADWALALAGAATYIAQMVGTALVGAWNKVGGWLAGKDNGLKRVVAMLVTGGLGLALQSLTGMLTHTTNWTLAFLLSALAGVVGTLNAGIVIDAKRGA